MYFVYTNIIMPAILAFSTYMIVDYNVSTYFYGFGRFINKRLGWQIFNLEDVLSDDSLLSTMMEKNKPSPVVEIINNKAVVNGVQSVLDPDINYKIDISETKLNYTHMGIAGLVSLGIVASVYIISLYWSKGGIDPAALKVIEETGKATKDILETIIEIKTALSPLMKSGIGNADPTEHINVEGERIRFVNVADLSEQSRSSTPNSAPLSGQLFGFKPAGQEGGDSD